MRIRASHYTCGCLLAAVMASPCEALAAEPSPDSKSAPAIAAPSLDAALVEYRRKLEEYTRARQQYGDEAAAYWRSVSEKRRLRNSKRRNNQEIVLDDYVLTQPPVYAGPAKPVDPSAPVPQMVPPPSKYVPVVADFLKSAEEQFNFVPQRPQSEIEYKRAYAKVASAAGLTKEQAVRIYGFEPGGNGTYDVQAGLEYPALGARASTTALQPAFEYHQRRADGGAWRSIPQGPESEGRQIERCANEDAGEQDRRAPAHGQFQPDRAG
jgi:hypothetical protein